VFPRAAFAFSPLLVLPWYDGRHAAVVQPITLVQHEDDEILNVFEFTHWCAESAQRSAVVVQEEFDKVPLEFTRECLLNELEDGVDGTWEIDECLIEEWESDVILFDEFFNPRVIVRLLVTELIAWPGEDHKTPVLVLVVQVSVERVRGRGQTSEGCDVGDESNVALVAG